MRFSVVIPNFNDIRITRAVRSIKRQTCQDYELVIIDGGSSSPEVLRYYETCGADHVVIERDRGLFDGLNKGIRRSRGDLIYLMGADDELSDEGVFATVDAAMDRNPALDGVCIGCEYVNAAGQVIRTWYPPPISARRIKRGLMPPHMSLFLKRELYDLVGDFKYEELGNVACDTVWLLDLAIKKPDLRISVEPKHHLRMEYGGASTRSLSAIYNQFRVVHRNARSNARHLPFWYLHSAVRTLSKVSQLRLFRR